MAVTDQLAAYLHGLSNRPMCWATLNCILMPADWIVARGHPDPAAPYRGRFRTRNGCRRFLAREGGAVAVMQAGADRIGLQTVETGSDLLPGDVGAVMVMPRPGATEEAGAIFDGALWVTKAPHGLIAGLARPLRAWRIG